MFNSFASSIIGFLIAALSTVGGHATITVSNTDTASTTQATTTEIQVDETFMTGLANALVRLQTRFEHGSRGRDDERRSLDGPSDDSSSASSSRSHSDDDENESGDDSGRDREDERRGSASVKSESRGEVELRGRDEEGEREFESEHGDEFEDEREDEGEDEDEHRNSGGSSSGSAGTSGSTGTSGSGSTSSSGGTTSSNTQTALTMSVVAAHNTAASCYSAINGNVYDLTAWISKHPGGQSAIKGICGVDGSAAFNGQHGSSGSPANVLAGYKIGVLSQ